MELTNDLSFSMYPREVALAYARRWRRALTFSVVVHLLAVAILLQQHLLLFQNLPLPLPPLTVVMMKAVQVPAAVLALAAVDEPARHEPVREQRQQSANRPASTEVLLAPADSTVTTPLIAQTTSDAVPPRVLAAPAVVAPPLTAQRQTQADPAALAGYNRALAAAVDRHKRYPRIALIRQWQGTVVLQLNIGVDGRVQEHHLARSSGFEALDQEALEMLREAMPLPALPAQLAGVSLSVDIPVVFRIAD